VRRRRAHKLFLELSQDLSTITSDLPDQVLCPLCLSAFNEQCLDSSEPTLTEEHIIPKELGGRRVTLTCKRCNNTHGHEIDIHLIQRVRVMDSLAGRGEWAIRGRIEVNGITVPTDVDWKVPVGETTSFNLRPNSPAVFDAIQQQMRSGQVQSINVTMRGDYIPERVSLAVLRIAYLVMFHEFGYRYILSPAAGVIRETLSQFESLPPQVYRLAIEIRKATPAPAEPWQLVRLRDEIGLMVIVTVQGPAKHQFATVMPGPTLNRDDVLDALTHVAEEFVSRSRP
jgi:hypothetical protein